MQHNPTDTADPQAHARTLSEQGEDALRAGELARAETLFEEAVGCWRALDDPASLAQAIHNLGVTYAHGRHFRRAVPLLEEAISLLEATGNRADEAIARNTLGNIHADLQDFPRAIAFLQSALPLRREAGNWRGLVLTLGCLARVLDQTCDRLEALEYRRRAYEAARTGDDAATTAEALLELARAAAAVGYAAEARQHFEQAAGMYATIGDTKGQGTVLLAQAEAHFEAGEHQAAVALAEQAFPLIRGTDAWTEMATQLEQLAHALRFAGQTQGMLRAWKRGSTPDVEGLRGMVQDQRAEEPDTSPVHQLLGGLGAMLDQFAGLSRPTPVAPQPTGDEQAATDTRSVEELLAALQAPGQSERRVAALALGLRGDPRAVEPLIATTRDRSQWVRMAAVRSLGKLKDRRALEAIAERLRTDRDKEVRRSAATSLRLLKDPRAVDALTTALTDENWRVAEAAEKALRALKVAPRVDILIDLLHAGDRERRCPAAVRLGDLHDRTAVAPLLEVAENAQEGEWLRVQALDAAAKLDAPRAAEVARRLLQARGDGVGINLPVELVCKAAGVSALAGDAAAQPALLVLLDHANPYVRLAVVQALGACGDEAAISALEQIQQRDHAIVQVDPTGMQRVRLRNAAAEAITAIRTRAAAREQHKG